MRVLNAATNTYTATITVGSAPLGMALSPDGSTLYVANHDSNDVSVINTATNAVTGTIAVGRGPFAMAILPNDQTGYVVDAASQQVSVVNLATKTVTTSIPLARSVLPIRTMCSSPQTGRPCTWSKTTAT